MNDEMGMSRGAQSIHLITCINIVTNICDQVTCLAINNRNVTDSIKQIDINNNCTWLYQIL